MNPPPPRESDFFGRLLDRAEGLAPVAEPRVPSLFEPPMPVRSQRLRAVPAPEGLAELVEAFSAEAAPDGTAEPSKRATRSAGREAPAPGPRMHPVADVADTSEIPSRDPNHSTLQRTEDARHSEELRPAMAQALLPSVTVQAHGAVLERPGAPRPVGRVPESERARPTSRLAGLLDLDRPALLVPAIELGGGVPAKSQRRAASAGAEPEHTSAPPDATAAGSNLSSRFSAHDAAISSLVREPPRRLEASPEPIVNVTIGRLEVRAVQTPSLRTRSESRVSNPLSLDAYLKQRGGSR